MKLIAVLKARSGGTRIEAVRIERQHALQPLDAVERQKAGDGKGQHRHRIDEPVLLARRVDAGQAIEAALDRPDDRAEKVSLACVDARR